MKRDPRPLTQAQRIWLASKAVAKCMAKGEVNLYGRGDEEIVNVWKYVGELERIGSVAFYRKYREFNLYKIKEKVMLWTNERIAKVLDELLTPVTNQKVAKVIETIRDEYEATLEAKDARIAELEGRLLGQREADRVIDEAEARRVIMDALSDAGI